MAFFFVPPYSGNPGCLRSDPARDYYEAKQGTARDKNMNAKVPERIPSVLNYYDSTAPRPSARKTQAGSYSLRMPAETYLKTNTVDIPTPTAVPQN